jgi:hypothetical protein
LEVDRIFGLYGARYRGSGLGSVAGRLGTDVVLGQRVSGPVRKLTEFLEIKFIFRKRGKLYLD